MPKPLLTPQEVETALKTIPAWEADEELQRISRTFEFPDFANAMVFVTEVAALAEEENHHPDITISYNKVTLALSTHSAGGLTERDFSIAAKIDGVV